MPVLLTKNKDLVKRMHPLAKENPRFGYRRIAPLWRAPVWRVNTKSLRRLWQREGLARRQRLHATPSDATQRGGKLRFPV